MFRSFDARRLHTSPADFLDAVADVGKVSLGGMMLLQSSVNFPSTLLVNSSCSSGYSLQYTANRLFQSS